MMTKPLVNVVVGDKTTQREMTDEEYAQHLKDAEPEYNAEILAIREIEAQRKAQRQALLDRLGITEEEAKLLLG